MWVHKISMSSILLESYTEPTRPVSQHEIVYLHNKLISDLKLATETVQQPRCKHIYYPKLSYQGRNCSVCYRLHHTEHDLQDVASNIIDMYMDRVVSVPVDELTHYQQDIERVYYLWLYQSSKK